MPALDTLRLVRCSLAFFWIYQGLMPKLLFISSEEIAAWRWLGFSPELAVRMGQLSGIGEIIFGLLFLFSASRLLHWLSIAGLIGLFLLIALVLPQSLIGAFNPVIMNGAMLMLSVLYLNLSRTDL